MKTAPLVSALLLAANGGLIACNTTKDAASSSVKDDTSLMTAAQVEGLVRIESAAVCGEFDPFIVDGCRYTATLNSHDQGSASVVFFINEDNADYLEVGDLLPMKLVKINKPEYPTQYFGEPMPQGTLLRIGSAPECAEFDPFVVDGCRYTARALVGPEQGKEVAFFINSDSGNYLKAGDLVDLKLQKIESPEYPTEFFGVANANLSLVRVGSGPECAEYDPFIVDGCRYQVKGLDGQHSGQDLVVFINSDSGRYLRAGDLVVLNLQKINKPEYPTEYFATH